MTSPTRRRETSTPLIVSASFRIGRTGIRVVVVEPERCPQSIRQMGEIAVAQEIEELNNASLLNNARAWRAARRHSG